MANKKKKKNSNSYWMKYGGVGPTKMDRFKGYIEKKHEGGFTHPHPHPKNASDEVLRGAQTWATSTADGNPLQKRSNYNFPEDKKDDVNAFMNSKWFNFYPDTLKDVPKNIEDLNKYEEAIGANRTRTIQLHDTDLSWDDIVGYGGGAAAWFGASNVAQLVPTPWTQLVGLGMKGLGALTVGGKLAYDNWYKKGENEQLKKDNPYATFVDGDGNILNYEDGNGLFFDLFHPSKENSITYNKNIRETPVPIEETENKEKVVTFAMGGNPYKKMYEGGGNPYHVSSQKNITEDPTFKMWFAKNATRSDVMQSSSDPQALKTLFLKDINFPGNEMPLFSGEIDGYGNIDKSNRTPELSSRIIGGMNKMYGGMGHSYKKPRAKAELGMGTGLYESPTDYIRDYSGVNETGRGGRNSNVQQTIGAVGEEGTLGNKFLKAFNYVIPGLGTGLDIVADIFRFKGDQKQHFDNVADANEAINNARTITKDGVNKDTLDLSTRLGGLEAVGSYLGTKAPTFDWGELSSNVMSIAGDYAGDIGKLFNKGTGDTPIPYDEIGADDIAPNPVGSAMYGGDMYKMGKGGRPGLWANMHAKRARGERPAKPGEEGYPKTLNIKEMGGANDFQPGAGIDIIGHHFNPLGEMQRFESQGAPNQSFNTGGDPNMQEYEAEGGETIMHQPGDIPVTTANTEQVDGDMNDAMVSMLEGASHENGGEIVQSSEGQYVFSKSLKSKTWGMNFADASEKIAQHIAKFKQEAEDGDAITKSTAMSMIDAWNQKLTDLQTEQESERQKKYMDLLNSGATEDELYEKFPDIHQQFMAQQQEQALSEASMQAIAGPMGGMADNPMGNIDMNELSAQDQQLVGAMYGLPQGRGEMPKAENGFDPYDFNRYFGSMFGNDFEAFDLNKKYQPNRGDVMSWLTANYPDGGFEIGDETFMNNKDAYKALMSGFGDWRSGELSDLDVPGSKPNKYNEPYMVETTTKNPWYVEGGTEDEFITGMDWAEGGKKQFQQDKNLWNYYNMGLGVDWSDNYGLDADMSKKQYFKALEAKLLSEGKDPADIKSIVEREKLKYDENLTNLQNIEDNKPLTPKEKADALAKQLRNEELAKKFGNFASSTVKDLMTLAPTLYNLRKSKEGAENEPFVSNENEALIKENLKRLTNSLDIQSLLEENEENFNSLKYLSRDASDGSSASMMNTLLRGQNIQNEADLKAFLTEAQLETQGLQIGNESLFNLGERDRQEGVRVNEANAMNRAAVEAFKGKGLSGLSGFSQLKQKMANEMSTDKNLANMLNMIYPDAQLYLNRDGTMDINKLMESGELQKLIDQYPQLKEYIEGYLTKEKE